MLFDALPALIFALSSFSDGLCGADEPDDATKPSVRGRPVGERLLTRVGLWPASIGEHVPPSFLIPVFSLFRQHFSINGSKRTMLYFSQHLPHLIQHLLSPRKILHLNQHLSLSGREHWKICLLIPHCSPFMKACAQLEHHCHYCLPHCPSLGHFQCQSEREGPPSLQSQTRTLNLSQTPCQCPWSLPPRYLN